MTKETKNSVSIEEVRSMFPILKQEVHNKPLIYLDNAATTQKPQSVLESITDYYSSTNANIHRGLHYLADKATAAFENTRKRLAKFINSPSAEEVIFTKGTTDSINLVASTFGHTHISKGDEVIITTMEHHSNIVPWQMLCNEREAKLKVIPINDEGELIIDEFQQLLSEKTKLVALVYVSNALGTINPVKEIIEAAHSVGAKVLLDGAQSTSHLQVDVQALDVDFYALSAHKMYGPTGVGALYGKRSLLESIPPYQGGGEMIKEVSFENTTYADLPYKFEAGTPNIGDVIAFENAIDFIEELGFEFIQEHEDGLLKLATDAICQIDGVKIIGQAREKTGVLSFAVDGVHHQDIGIMMDTHGVAIRTGHHCTQPLMNRFDLLGTSRMSFAVYNSEEEVTKSIEALEKVLKILR